MPSHLSFLFQNFGPVITSLLKLPQFHEEDLCKVHTLFNFYYLMLQKKSIYLLSYISFAFRNVLIKL